MLISKEVDSLYTRVRTVTSNRALSTLHLTHYRTDVTLAAPHSFIIRLCRGVCADPPHRYHPLECKHTPRRDARARLATASRCSTTNS
ncbi:hypothetical protein J6590_076201 [Homalodisca vitripennis]|nr:hypothetical protein J6590_076201 [Homalodisca vitripennis]